MAPLEIRELTPPEMTGAAEVLGRGMRDNPLHVEAFGADPARREVALTKLFGALLRQYVTKGIVLGALSSDRLVGVCASVHPGRCQPTVAEKFRLLPALLMGSGVTSSARVLTWTSRWAAHDPTDAHSHLGPVGVEQDWQRGGVGSALMREFCARIDAAHAMAYLETDRHENVRFYQRFGFEVTEEERVLGVPNWFMQRAPLGDPGAKNS